MTAAVMRNSGCPPVNKRYVVTIETTSVCNLACPLCPTGMKTLERENKYISLEYFHKIIRLTEPLAQSYVISVLGEPTFHPQFAELAEATRALPTWMSTNLNYGEEIIRELSQWEHLHVICSIDTLNAEEYPSYRVGGDYEKVMKNLKLLVKGKCRVYPQFLVSAEDYDEAAFTELANELCIPVGDIIVKTKLENFDLGETDKPVAGNCHSCYTGMYFNCDGYQVPCCNNVKNDLYIQHIDAINTTDDLMKGEAVVRARRALAKDKNTYPSCGRCTGLNFWRKDFREYLRGMQAFLPKQDEKKRPNRVTPNGS